MIKINENESTYPEKLKIIKNKPKQLYIEGNLSLLNKIGIAVIGTRHPTEYGKRMCRVFTKELVQYGIIIISGMADGIDSIAHKTCLENGGNTIAVLPSGLENIYPQKNQKLFKDVLNLNGTVVTEYSPKEKADSKKFLERNRIVSGLAIGTLVIEAGYRSGTSVTARITREQQKPVFCIPSSLENKQGVTCNQIIQNGGKLVSSVDNILEEFKNINFKRQKSTVKINLIDKELKCVYEILNDNPQHINEIAQKLNSNISIINYKLMLLELEEYIIELPGKYYIRK